jgi:hypothetical protein
MDGRMDESMNGSTRSSAFQPLAAKRIKLFSIENSLIREARKRNKCAYC